MMHKPHGQLGGLRGRSLVINHVVILSVVESQQRVVVSACCLHDNCAYRLLRHDMVAELCEKAVRFQQAGGTASVLPTGASSGRALLPGSAEDMTLFV